jgi:hypothetical protein
MTDINRGDYNKETIVLVDSVGYYIIHKFIIWYVRKWWQRLRDSSKMAYTANFALPVEGAHVLRWFGIIVPGPSLLWVYGDSLH